MRPSRRSLRSVFQRPAVEKTAWSFAAAGSVGIGDDRLDDRHDGVRHPLDDGLEQRLLRVEVVVEGALRRPELVEDVLDAHLLVALRPDEPLGDVEEGVAADGMDRRVDGAGHADLH